MCRSILGDIVGKATCANCTRQLALKEKTRAGGAESDRFFFCMESTTSENQGGGENHREAETPEHGLCCVRVARARLLEAGRSRTVVDVTELALRRSRRRLRGPRR